MSTEKAPQNSGSGTDSQAPDNGANTGATPFLPFDQNQMRQFFKAVKILLEKSAKPEERPVKASQPSLFKVDPEDLERFLRQLENVYTELSNKILGKFAMQPIYCIEIKMTSLETQQVGMNLTI